MDTTQCLMQAKLILTGDIYPVALDKMVIFLCWLIICFIFGYAWRAHWKSRHCGYCGTRMTHQDRFWMYCPKCDTFLEE